MQRKAQPSAPVRRRRVRLDLRASLLDAALVEFGAHGFDGASTRAIARRVDAHQPQINYHFDSKAALWTAAVDHLFGLLGDALADVFPANPTGVNPMALADAFAEGIRRFVAFAAAHPELNQIMVHEATMPSDRLTWMVETHVRGFFEGIQPAWRLLRDAGVAAPIDGQVLYYVLVGASSLPYVNAPEVVLLTGRDPREPAWIEAHADAVVCMLLPGLRVAKGERVRGQ
jgi:TetR/AcrR family transcriptional regulator